MLKVKAKLRKEPWNHIYFESVFTVDVYPQLLASKPPISECTPIYPLSWRVYWPLEGRTGLWGSVHDALTKSDFLDTFAKMLGITRSYYPKVALCRDLPGYMKKPHLDDASILMTIIIFLPESLEQRFLGTRLLERDAVAFIKIKQLGFFPNVGVAFRNSGIAWHEAPIVELEDGIRDTLQIQCFDTPEGPFR